MFPILKANGELKTGYFQKKLKKSPIRYPPYLKKDNIPPTSSFINFSLHNFKYNQDNLPYFWEK